MRPRFIALIVALLLADGALVEPPEPKVRVPYSPYFLDQVRAGNVKQINTRGEEVTGEFRTKVKYPKPDSPAAAKFETQIPSFVDNVNLDKLLAEKHVVISA